MSSIVALPSGSPSPPGYTLIRSTKRNDYYQPLQNPIPMDVVQNASDDDLDAMFANLTMGGKRRKYRQTKRRKSKKSRKSRKGRKSRKH
jgi:hypothetical protein